MFRATTTKNSFILFHEAAGLITQTLEDFESYEVFRSNLAFTLTYYYFLQVDGEHLAEVKASELCGWVADHLPHELEFELKNEQLEQVINLALCQNAAGFFDEYCSQQLYIRSLHTLVTNQDDTSVPTGTSPQNLP